MPVLLLVEDDTLVALPVEHALVEAGYQVDTATSGEEAIKVLDKRWADMAGLITDIRLGGTLGWDVARRARELNPDIPVIYCSADSAQSWKANGVPNSVMISKPFALGQVTTAISQLLNASDAPPAG